MKGVYEGYIALGPGKRIMVSPEGTIWTIRKSIKELTEEERKRIRAYEKAKEKEKQEIMTLKKTKEKLLKKYKVFWTEWRISNNLKMKKVENEKAMWLIKELIEEAYKAGFDNAGEIALKEIEKIPIDKRKELK